MRSEKPRFFRNPVDEIYALGVLTAQKDSTGHLSVHPRTVCKMMVPDSIVPESTGIRVSES
eukprot:SAG31_NODE_13829_length_843_cov_1.905914_2_plen_60_part_01